MEILISGGAGFIGSHLAVRLLALGHRVTVLDNLLPQVHGEQPAKDSYLYRRVNASVAFVKGDVTSRQDWEKCLENKDAVVHLAAETGTGQSMYRIARYTDVNVCGTATMLDVLANASRHSVKKIVLASSRAVYGEGKYRCPDGRIVYPPPRRKIDLDNGIFEVQHPGEAFLQALATDESSALHPTSVYGLTKLHQEQLLTTVCPAIDVAPVVLRYQNVYGPGQSLRNPYTGILSIFSTLICQGKELNIFEDGQESRDFVFIDDVVEATVLALTRGEANGQVFNVGAGKPVSVLEVAKTLMKYFGKQVKFNVSGNYRLGDIRHNFADISRINKELGYTPLVSFDEGIRRFVAWVNEQGVQESGYEDSLTEMAQRGMFK
ncbi:dTDP-L-rhamnose 4-epimerase [Parapedobacter composti]|uniref:dTDP-L-rhamnose 4-epimerase n=1 Tax=Parapedobacter composti TaxID=623281 RepID=A0A1I1IDF3_9SPHI|nr:NAD-dependent epimerase/dehydratase family protein [Parapedobacter composti]SFC31773.1 dTDP-L-rhamnose 4-epimerase [Parapedobacter composti]